VGGFAVIATQLTDQSLRPWTLTVGGVDVLGLNGSSYGVPIESVEVVEQGPNGVSSMHFRIWDPAKEVNLREMDEVEFWQQQGIDLPFFAGFVQEWTLTTRGVGRYIDVECIGIEAVLDWMIIPVETVVPVDTVVFRAVLALVGRATGVGVQIRAFSECPDEVTNKESSQAFPVAGMGVGGLTPATLASTVTIAEGSSLREALVTVGERGRWIGEAAVSSGLARVTMVHDADEARAAVERELAPGVGDLVLVKGSRGIELDRLVAALGDTPDVVR